MAAMTATFSSIAPVELGKPSQEETSMEVVEEIAIVGIGCRFPGANNIKEFWNVLVNGENHVNEIPGDRWNLDAIYDPDPDAYGKTYVRRAGLLSKHDMWDNVFFGIAEKEASEMDPQQRYVLECVHMALEDGGITRSELDGSPTSVYIGAMNSDSKTSKDGDYSLMTNYSVTGDAASIITARVSYNYNLLGPSLTIDTACSSSLVAVNLATQSLQIGESSMAICGGVNSILYPDMFVTLTKARMASPTGQCQAFSANADGYARGEGCGIVILERLSDALKNGRHIWATIRTGCNQDGQTAKPITAPSQIQQNRLLHDIYIDSYNINPSHVQYIEAHGTGTPIGDPIEVGSLGSFFKEYPLQHDDVTKQRFIGSVKTNIGHLESGAGAASLIKTLLMMKHRQIVPSLHSLPRNPKIDFEDYQLHVPTSVYPWPALEDGSRAACINCFGFGGTNSHAFVRQWVEKPALLDRRIDDDKLMCVPVSAKSPKSLINTMKHMVSILAEEPCDLKQLAFTASCKRDHHRYRKMFIESNITDLIKSCNNVIDIMSNSAITSSKKYRKVYVFCGVGTAWTNMGMELANEFPVFTNSLRQIDTYLKTLTGWSIEDKLRDGAEMDDPFISHIGIFACQVGLSDLWKHWGISPDAIVGQSVGEVAAAYCSGVLSLSDAVKVIYHRSKLLAMESGGRMMVVRNTKTTTIEEICDKIGHVNIAVHSSPVACTISGGDKQVDAVKSLIIENAKTVNEIPFFHDLKVDCAYHSYKVENAARCLKECLEGIKINQPNVPVFSTVKGSTTDDFGTADYWSQNVAKTVMFHQALQKSINDTSTIFIEIGPKPVLKAHLNDIFKDDDVTTVPSMKLNSGSSQVKSSLCDLYAFGIDPHWENLVEKNNLATLPQYQFDGKHLMVESDYRFLRKQGLIDDSSGQNLMLTRKGDDGEFKVKFSPKATPFVYEHVIDDAIIIPGAVYTEVAFELGMSVMGIAAEEMHVEYDIISAIPLSKGKPSSLDMTTEVTEENDGSTSIMFSITKDEKAVAKGCVTNRNHTTKHSLPIEDVCIRNGKRIERKDIYSKLAKHGYKYGPSVQVLESIIFENNECTGFIHLTDEVSNQLNQTSFHPAILDAMLHSSALDFLSNQKDQSYKIYPIRVGSVSVLRPFDKRMVCYTKTIQKVYDRIITNIILTRLDGMVLAEVKEIEHRVLGGDVGVNNLAYEIIWTGDDVSMIHCDTQHDLNRKVTICCNDESVISTLRNVYPEGDSFCLRDAATDPMSVICSEETNDVDLLIFVPDSSHVMNKNDKDVFDIVSKNCEAFLNIMKVGKEMKKTIIVVTENTQAFEYETDSNRNVLGAELWGFSRSLRKENTKCQMIVIDVQPSVTSEVKTLYKTIQAHTSGNITLHNECIINDGHLHSNFLRRRPQSGLQIEHRTLSTDTHLDLQLRSTSSDKIESPYLISVDRSFEVGKNEVCVEVDQMCIHFPTEFCVTELDSSLDKSLWSDYKDGYPVIGLEFQGIIRDSKMFKKTPRRVVVCYPTRITNRITVPELCVCHLDSLPNYIPGLIIKCLLMWSITAKVKRNSNVCIVTNSNTSDDPAVIILQDMLKTVKNCRVQITAIGALEDVIESGCNVFVVLEKFSKAELSCILQPGNIILGFDDAMLCLSNQVIQFKSKRIHVHIITKVNVFEENNIIRKFPKVKHWLTRRLKRLDLSENARNSMQLQTIRLSDTCNDGKKGNIETKAMGDKLFHKNAAYVVVGGMTGLGWEIVKWLGMTGAGVVIPVSRKGKNPDMSQQLQNAMDLHKFKIVPMKCNIVSYADVERTFSCIKMQFPNHPIKGIFQGAGVLRDTRIDTMTMDKFNDVLQPKVTGTWNLHLVSKELPLDFFVMHSSVTSVFGNAGQTNYGAANSFMDSLAWYRRANHLPGQSINWGALAVGMANDEIIRNNLEAQGYYVLETDKIKECLLDALIRNHCQIIYGAFDWSIVGQNPAMMRTQALDKEEAAVVGKSNHSRFDNIVLDIAEFMEAPFEDQRRTLADLLFNSISRVLSIDESELEENQNLLGLGMESQKAVELIQIIKEATGCRLPVAYVLSTEYTIGMLNDFIHSHIVDNFVKEANGELEMKENVYGSPSWMQKFYIDMHNNCVYDSSLWFSVDFKLGSGLSNVDVWRTVLRWITIKNAELRTLYHHTNKQIRFGMEKVVVDPEDSKIDLRVVDSSMLSREWTEQDIKQYCTFDITADPPLRVLYGNTGKKHHIRFILCHVTFDLQSFFILLPQFRSYFLTYFLKRDICITPPDSPDIAELMEERLDLDRLSLEEFWRGELKKIQDIPTLDTSDLELKNDLTLISKKTDNVSLLFPKQLVDKMINNDHGITPSILLFSLYQIILHKMTGSAVIPVVLTVDMRRYFPEFIDRIFLGTNYVPVITEFPDVYATLRDLISKCSNQMTMSSANSIYPYLLIKQTDVSGANCFRHFFNVRDITFRDRNPVLTDYSMEHAGHSTGFLNQIETALNVFADRQNGTIELTLSYDPAIVSSSTAKRMVDDLLLLACVSVTNSEFQLDELPLESCVSNASDKIDCFLSTVKFLKETSNGWEHPVMLKVDMDKEVPQITWRNPDTKEISLRSIIPVSSVLDVETGKLNILEEKGQGLAEPEGGVQMGKNSETLFLF
ncbi:uncharacterized protein LOC132558089 [Ylistrum balloti]|uniref:uncharacterized protein LOC132558089 n=1 Tax=Ylistrum balloti TaxID=509963 RepID=UPI002905D579|nr:uncharacterized protein LOC132558089 [Ylistrum balloti]